MSNPTCSRCKEEFVRPKDWGIGVCPPCWDVMTAESDARLDAFAADLAARRAAGLPEPSTIFTRNDGSIYD